MTNINLVSFLRTARITLYTILLSLGLMLINSTIVSASSTSTIAIHPGYDASLKSSYTNFWNTTRAGINVLVEDTISSRTDFRLSDWYYGLTLSRYHAEFNTSQLNPEDEIVSAKLRLYFNPSNVGNMTSNNGWVVVPSDITGGTSDQKWDTYTTAISTSYSGQTRLNSAGYTDFELNSAGIAALNRTGTTSLGLVSYWDSVNTDPNQSYGAYKNDNGTLFMRHNTGTSSDPVLIIEIESPEPNPTAPSSLETEGQTNPTDVEEREPEFSAIYEDPNAGDIATHYQIQVSTSTSFDSLLWDTSSTTLLSPVTEGERMEEVSYDGTPLNSGISYYWRIKFWDEDGNEGVWSSPANFELVPGTVSTEIYPTYDAFLGSSYTNFWNTTRAGVNVSFEDSISSRADFRVSDWYYGLTIHRYHAEFDTSQLNPEDEIVSAKLRLYFNPANTGNMTSNNGWAVVPSDITGSTNDQKWDAYTSAISTNYSGQTRVTTSGYTDFELNSAGLAALNTTGTTSLGLVSYWDLINTDPNQVYGGYKNDNGTLFMRNNTGTSSDPVLVIETAY